MGGCRKWQGASPNCVPGSREMCFTGSGEPGGGRGWGGAEPSPGRAQTPGPWGILAEGLQKQSGVQRTNCGWRQKIETVGKYMKIGPQSTSLEKVGGRR